MLHQIKKRYKDHIDGIKHYGFAQALDDIEKLVERVETLEEDRRDISKQIVRITAQHIEISAIVDGIKLHLDATTEKDGKNA